MFAKSAAGLADEQLEVEAEGLHWLAEVDGVPVPEVLAVTADVLVIDWIPPGSTRPGTDERLGRALARLHAGAPAGVRVASRRVHRTGAAAQHADGHRLAHLLDRAPDRPARRSGGAARRARPAARPLVDGLRRRLPERAGPPEVPVRVHGDLWSGNVLVDEHGEPWLVDPAAYAGHREVDLAMLHLFGTPGPACTAAYDEALPLAPGWRERLALWQLEPLLVHAVLFGGGYGASALRVLERFGQ